MWLLAAALLAGCDAAVVSAPMPASEPPRTPPQRFDPLPPRPDTLPLFAVDTVDARCPAPRSLLPRFAPESRIVKALRNGEPLTIVAIGSSSTEGVGATTVERTYPGQMQRMLSSQWPRSTVRVVNVGIGGNTAEHMVARFARDVYAHNPDVVIFQAGTIEAITRSPINHFMRVFRDGIAQLRARGYDVVIMDSQYYPGEGETPSYAAYQDSMAVVAAQGSLPLVRRYEMMRHYVDTRRYTLRELLWSDVFHPSEITYECASRIFTRGLELATAP